MRFDAAGERYSQGFFVRLRAGDGFHEQRISESERTRFHREPRKLIAVCRGRTHNRVSCIAADSEAIPSAFMFDSRCRVSTSLVSDFDLNSLDWVSLNCTECGHSVEILRLDLEYQSEATSDCPVCGSTRSIAGEPDATTSDTDAAEPPAGREPSIASERQTKTDGHVPAEPVAVEETDGNASAKANETVQDADRTVCNDDVDETGYSDDEWDDPAIWQDGVIEDKLPEIQFARTRRRKSAPKSVRQRLAAWLKQRRSPAAAALISSVVHGLVLLVLALIAVQINRLTGAGNIESSFSDREMAALVELPELQPVEMALANRPIERRAPEGVDVRRVLRGGDAAVISSADVVLRDASKYSTQRWGVPSGNGFEGRQGELRANLAEAHGGTPESEAAVEAGLEWLARHQNIDGSWSFRDFLTHECGTHCGRPGRVQAPTGATGLALMCFLGAGYTHADGKYQDVVHRGLDWLKDVSDANSGDLRTVRMQTEQEQRHGMYAQGMAAIALCEAYGMTRDESLRAPATAAIRYIADAQHPTNGGWRYYPGDAGDTSVVGWQVMALVSGRMSGLSVSRMVHGRVIQFLDLVHDRGRGQFGYTSRYSDHTRATTAIGMLCRMYLEPDLDREQYETSINSLTSRPAERNEYDLYYISQVLHHWGGERWHRWNTRMRQHLIQTQSDVEHASGSWPPEGRWGHTGGRLYATCMHILTLEVYYRHLPLYRDESFLFTPPEQ